VLADINNLAPDASVMPGQKLIIPADLVKPEYNSGEQPVNAEVAQTKLEQPVSAAAAQDTIAEVEVMQPAKPDNNNEFAAVAIKVPEAKPEAVVVVADQSAEAAPAKPLMATGDMSDSMPLEVGVGETLWDFAKRTTGDATNWRTIAAHNKFDEQQLGLIRPGQKIYVPASIVRARDANGALIAKGEESLSPEAKIGGVAPENVQAIAATAAVLTGTNKPAEAPAAEAEAPAVAAATPANPDETKGDIKIVEAAFQDDGAIKPVTAESLSEEASVAVDSNAKLGKVMVKGTYYPKAVYNNADFSSSLLMRVSPGTQLLVSKAIGPWLEVKTEKGVGYVHSRDI